MRDLFKILRLSSNASEADVRSAYRHLALETHPDKGGSADAFRLVVEAFEILSDPCRRAAYQAASLKRSCAGSCANADRTNITVPCQPGKQGNYRRRSQEVPKYEQSVRDNANNRSQKETDSVNRDVADVLRELLGMLRKDWDSRLRDLDEQTLRDLFGTLQRTEGALSGGDHEEDDSSDSDDESIDGGLATLAISDGTLVEEPACSQACDGVVMAHSIDTMDCDLDGKEEGSPQQLKQHVQMRGICKSHGTFFVIIGLEHMLILSQSGLSLDIAIDMHISLVRLRQLVRTDLQVGVEFRHALLKGIDKMHEERELGQLTRLVLSFRTQCPFQKLEGKWRRESMQTRDVDEALKFWEKRVGELVQKKYEMKRKRMEAQKLSQQLRETRRQKRAAELEEKLAKRQRQDEKSRQKKHAQTEKKQECASQRRQSLCARVRKFLSRAEIMRSSALLKKWGVRELPQGIEEGTLREVGDCLRASLVLSDGSVRPGPLRRTLAEACTDFNELSILMAKVGDDLACQELERRDIDAMTSFFREDMYQN